MGDQVFEAELLDVYAVRRLLQVEAAGLGAVEISADDLEQLRRVYEEMEQATVDREVLPT